MGAVTQENKCMDAVTQESELNTIRTQVYGCSYTGKRTQYELKCMGVITQEKLQYKSHNCNQYI